MTLPELLQSIPDDLLHADRRHARSLERYCVARGYRPTFAQLHAERARRHQAPNNARPNERN